MAPPSPKPLADYTPPTADEIPPIALHHIESPAAFSITGAKV
jgi:CO/xanthine dehydrogenase Mo-binding subunit